MTDDRKATCDGLTKEQQDTYFHDDRCPYCGCGEMGCSSWMWTDGNLTKYREVICCNCDEEWYVIRYIDGGCPFLLTPAAAEEELWGDEYEDDGEDSDDDEDDPDDDDEGEVEDDD